MQESSSQCTDGANRLVNVAIAKWPHVNWVQQNGPQNLKIYSLISSCSIPAVVDHLLTCMAVLICMTYLHYVILHTTYITAALSWNMHITCSINNATYQVLGTVDVILYGDDSVLGQTGHCLWAWHIIREGNLGIRIVCKAHQNYGGLGACSSRKWTLSKTVSSEFYQISCA